MRLSEAVSKYLFKRGWPYLHFCVINRDCRREGAPPRIYLHNVGPFMVFVDLPGWWTTVNVDFRPLKSRQWHNPSFRAFRRTK